MNNIWSLSSNIKNSKSRNVGSNGIIIDWLLNIIIATFANVQTLTHSLAQTSFKHTFQLFYNFISFFFYLYFFSAFLCIHVVVIVVFNWIKTTINSSSSNSSFHRLTALQQWPYQYHPSPTKGAMISNVKFILSVENVRLV